jgi:hypothetical protein
MGMMDIINQRLFRVGPIASDQLLGVLIER